jgi:hypothetical protein
MARDCGAGLQDGKVHSGGPPGLDVVAANGDGGGGGGGGTEVDGTRDASQRGSPPWSRPAEKHRGATSGGGGRGKADPPPELSPPGKAGRIQERRNRRRRTRSAPERGSRGARGGLRGWRLERCVSFRTRHGAWVG